MTWIKLDDRAPRHPKLASLTDRAFRWWILGLCYASEFLTNGVLHPVFWKRTPPSARKELSSGKLWDWEDPNFLIHDYLEHQASRESVEKERRRNRERRRCDRRDDAGRTSGTTAGSPAEKPRPESREQRTDTENRAQKEQAASSSPLIKTHAYIERRLQHCAFVGARLEVPKALHAELRTSLGGPDPEKVLRDWYIELDEEAETNDSRVPIDKEIFKWLKGHYANKFPIAPVAVNGTKRDDAAVMARLEAIERGEIKR